MTVIGGATWHVGRMGLARDRNSDEDLPPAE